MKVRDLLSLWEQTASSGLTEDCYKIRLPLEDAAKLKALAELYPRRHVEELITDLLSASLNELEGAMPYVRGKKVVTTDELGDPVYEDVGPTPRYLSLTEKHMSALKNRNKH